MKTRPAPGGSDPRETLSGEANAAGDAALDESGASARRGGVAEETSSRPSVVDEVEALYPGTAAGPTPVAAPRLRTDSRLREVWRNMSLDDRAGRILLSMVLAVLLWFYVTSLENPALVTEFNDLTLEQRNVGQNLKVINTVSNIDVTLQAPQNVMTTLRPGDVHPYVDLQGLDTGVHQVPVKLEVNGAAGRSLISSSVAPREVQVQLEAQATRVLTVSVRTDGTPAFGYGMKQPQVDPLDVAVSGPSDAIGRIAQVVVNVSVNGEATTQQGLKSPVALDADGRPIQGLTFDPEAVQVVVPIELLLNYKLVAVRANVVGNPAPGYSVVAINPEPRSVTICCAAKEVLDPIQSLDTVPVGITNTTSTVITRTRLIIPEGVELYPGQSSDITVTIRLETFETSFTLAVVPTVEGLAPGTGAVVSPSSIDVRLSGTLAQFQQLRPEEVRAVLNLGGRGPGTYEIEPQIVVPQGIKVEGAEPTRLTVSVLAPTVAPVTATALPLASPTATTEPAPTAGAVGLSTASPARSPEPTVTPTSSPEPGASGQAVSPVPTTNIVTDETR